MRIEVRQHAGNRIVANAVCRNGVDIEIVNEVQYFLHSRRFPGLEKAVRPNISPQPKADEHPDNHHDGENQGCPDLYLFHGRKLSNHI